MAPTIRSAVVLVALGAVTTGCAGAADGPREIVAEPDWLKRAILSGKDSSQQAADGTDIRDVNGDGWMDVASAWQQRGRTIVHINPGAVRGGRPFRGGADRSKGVAVGDVDGDGSNDIVLNVNATKGYKVYWLSADRPTARRWTAHPISTEGQKYDNIDLVDLDRDGDLDVVTSEEVKRLGVIWLENP